MRKLTGIVLCAVVPATIGLYFLEEWLLRAGILNTMDMPPFVGNETGTVSEYILNAWHWDAVIFLVGLAALPCLFTSVVLLLGDLQHVQSDEPRGNED